MSLLERWRKNHPSPRSVLTNPALATTVLARLKGRHPRITRTNLKNKLSDLDRGITTWWKAPKRRDVLEALAGVLLAATPEEILGGRPSVETSQRLEIGEWPTLRSVDLFASELLPSLAEIQTRSGDARATLLVMPWSLDAPATPAWVTIPSGAGRTTLAAFHRARHDRELPSSGNLRHGVSSLEVDNLSEALSAAKTIRAQERLVVVLRDYDPVRDRAATEAALACRGLVVLAPASLPSDRGTGSDGTPWHEYDWAPQASWTGEFVDWLALRLTDGIPDLEGLKARLRVISRTSVRALVPRDVVALARAWTEVAKNHPTTSELLARAASDMLERRVRQAPVDDLAKAWLVGSAYKILCEVARSTWSAPGRSSTHPGEQGAWMKLLPRAHMPPAGIPRMLLPASANDQGLVPSEASSSMGFHLLRVSEVLTRRRDGGFRVRPDP